MVETANHQHPPPQQAAPPPSAPSSFAASRGPTWTPAEQLQQLQYCIHSNPSWPQALLLAFQHYIVLLGTVVLIANMLVTKMGGTHGDKARVIQTLLFMSGINTLLQTLIGTRLPTVMGPSFAFILPVLAVINDYSEENFTSGHQMSTEGPSDTPSSSSKRKGRGPNQINFNKIAKAKEVGVTFNELGQPLGDSSIALSTCIGTITTQIIPITYSSWPEVPDVVKDSVWETMKARFGLDDVGKSNVFNSMNTCWRQYKSRLTKRIRELSSGPEAGRMIQLLKPTNITDEDWSQFVSNRLSSEFDIISSKYSDLAKKNKAPHTTSRKGLARLREDLRAKKSVESGDLEYTEVDKVETWIAGHKHKDGMPVTEDTGEIIKQLEEIFGNQATSISDDVVSQVLGKEHRGRVRGLGGGVTPTRVNASVVGKQTTTQLREKMKKQNKRHEDEMNRQQDEMNALKQQLKDLQSFVFNMQTNDRGHSAGRGHSHSMHKGSTGCGTWHDSWSRLLESFCEENFGHI
ncbi:hypothetical protein ACOSQ2_011097 [Xanthoceras sorbifolium]